jgi:adenosine deaminase
VLQDAPALELQSADLVGRLAAEEVVYAEVRFAPLLHTAMGMRPEAAVETVLNSRREASARHGINSRVILCSLRHFDSADSLRTAELAVKHAEHGVGLDLGGPGVCARVQRSDQW